MRGLKKLLIICAVIICAFSFNVAGVAPGTYADDACEVTGYDDPLLCPSQHSDEEKELMARIKAILNTIYLWVGIIAVIVIVIGGVKYMTSAGEADKIKNAKSTITYAIIGLIVTLAAFAITNFFIDALEGRDDAGSGQATADHSDPSHDPYAEGRNKVRAISVVDKVQVVAGQTVRLKPKIIPDYATNHTVNFASADNSIATVSKSGLVSAKREGETTVTVSSPEGISKDVKVIVLKPVAVQSIQLSATKVEVRKGKTVNVTAVIKPTNAADKTIGWESADPKVATVTQSGTIKGIKEGTTKVTVIARNKLTFAYAPTKDIVLADTIDEIKASPTAVRASLTVTVPSDTWGIATTPTTQRNFTGDKSNPKFTAKTQEIVDKHKSEFNCKTFNSFMKSKGGYTAYVKSLGGIFAVLSGKKVNIKTAADLQAAAEYVYGLWSIWGPDYNNWFKSPCSTCKYINWNASDAFYSACPGLRGNSVGYSVGYAPNKSIDEVLSASKKVRTHCNGSADIFLKSIGNPWPGSSAGPNGMIKRGGKKITGVKNLQVGDILAFFKGGNWRHTAIVGEVYKDYIVTYDGGSGSIRRANPGFKRAYKRTEGGFYSDYAWYAVRVFNIDQTKTLEGL